jgi:ATP-dependent DNA ligase
LTGYSFEPLEGLPRLGPEPPPPRDPRFVPGPAELCQLAGTWSGEPLDWDWIAEEKFDGIRLLWIGGQMVTREGEPFHAAEHLRPLFERLERRCGMPMFFDSEYCEEGGFLATLAAFRRGHGNGKAILFDGMALDAWLTPTARRTRTLQERRSLLASMFADWEPAGVQLVRQYGLLATRSAHELAQSIWDRGGEGIVLKRKDAPYARTRSTSWLKLKRKLRLVATVAERISEASLRVDYQGRKLRVSITPSLRPLTLAVGMTVVCEAMEWTKTGQLRSGVAVEMGGAA